MASHYENYQSSGQNSAFPQQSQNHQANQQQFIDFYKQGGQQIQGSSQMSMSGGSQHMPSQIQQQMGFLPHSGNFSGSSQSHMFSNINQNPIHKNIQSGINVYQSQPRERFSYEGPGHSHGHHQPSRSNANNNAMLITSSEQFDSTQYQQQQMDPSPINSNSQMNRGRGQGSSGSVQLTTDNRILNNQNNNNNIIDKYNNEQQQQNINALDTKMVDMRQIQMVDRNVAHKRRSIENKESLIGNDMNKGVFNNYGAANTGSQQNTDLNNNRLFMNGAKSALSNYGNNPQMVPQQHKYATISNQVPASTGLKQINKQSKVERDPLMMDINPSTNQYQYQQQLQVNNTNNNNNSNNKRTLAKSQSQNRLVLLSQDVLHKNNPYGDQAEEKDNQVQTDKNSFFKDQVVGRGGVGQTQDLLYKQHMQYSGGHQNNLQKNWLLKASSNNLVLSRMTTKSECTFCNKTSAGGGMISLSSLPHYCSSIYCSKDNQGMMIQNNLSKKYSTNRDYYNLKIVNDLIYNENTHIVSIFKDYLILDDINEFLKRSYTQAETKSRLPKLCSFYEKYSQVFPNYVVLPESKYMFKNIQRKQKLIDEQYQIQEELAKKQHQTLLDEDKLFNTKFYNSYYSNMGGGGGADLSMSRKQYEDQAKVIAEQAGKKPTTTRIDQMKMDELVDRFLMKDSESNIQLLTSMALDFSEFQNSFANQSQHSKIIGSSALPQQSNKNQPQAIINKQSVLKQSTPGQANKQNQQSTAIQQKNQQVVNQINMIKNNLMSQNNQAANVGQAKRSLDGQGQKRVQPQSQLNTQNTGSSTQAINKKQKNSFNNNQATQQQNKQTGGTLQVPKLDTNKLQNENSSNKNTPRLQKGQAHINSQQQIQELPKPIIQTSPGTKDAITNYLQDCNLNSDDIVIRSGQKLQAHAIDGQYKNMQDIGPLISPGSTNLGSNLLESPQLKSPPNYIGPKNPLQNAVNTGSQNSLHSQQQQFQNSLSQQSRLNMKSQCVLPSTQSQQITNMKKTTTGNRLSNGGAALKQHNQQQLLQNQRKNASPVPSLQKQGQQQQASNQHQLSSRNQYMNSNSTQKSVKSIQIVTQPSAGMTHTKYLSGGNDQYQKMLGNLNTNINNNLNGNYETQTVNSSSKKSTNLHAQRYRPEQQEDNNALSQSSHAKQQPPQIIKQPSYNNDNFDNEVITGEDCDDFGIADERFASPDANKIIFQTLDDNIQGLLSHGRKSIDSKIATTVPSNKQGFNQQQNMMLLTSSDDKLFQNTNNYDQIKKHLEQYISVTGAGGTQSINNMMVSIPSQQTFDIQHSSTINSNSKHHNVHVKSTDRLEEVKQSITSLQPGYNRDGMASSSISIQQQQQQQQQQNQQQYDQSNSRNGTQKKQFESLKQKIRGHFDHNQQQPTTIADQQNIQSANKTPNKSSTHSKKSTHNPQGMSQNQQQMMLQQNRMSLESNQVLMMMPNSNTNQNGIPLTSTSANGRQLSFSQTSFTHNASNYRSITNLQQRKGSNNNSHKDMSIENNNKRLSGQNRQSFKELSQQSNTQQQQSINTALNSDSNKIIKRSATGKTLNLMDASGAHSQSYNIQNNFLQSIGSSNSIQNPNFIQSNHHIQNNRLYATTTSNQQNQMSQNKIQIQNLHHQQQMQQQAANQVRVMTPSYSLASLSKIISPTTITSPMTMTVTVANGQNTQVINRKQATNAHRQSNGKSSALGVHSQSSNQYNPSSISNTLQNSHSQNLVLSDKGSKLTTSSIYQNSQKNIISSKVGIKSNINIKSNNTLQAQSHPIQISTTINQKLGRVPANHHQLQSNSNLSLNQPTLVQTFQATPRGNNLIEQQQNSIDLQSQINPNQMSVQSRRVLSGQQPNINGVIFENSQQNMSYTGVSADNKIINNNSTAKAIESNKHPKFMRTIEEFGSQGTGNMSSGGSGGNQPIYNTMLSASMGQGKVGIIGGSAHTLTNSLSQAQLEVKNQKNKMQTVVNSNQASIKRQTLGPATSTLSSSGSVSHFKSPSQQINSKKQLQGRYLNM